MRENKGFDLRKVLIFFIVCEFDVVILRVMYGFNMLEEFYIVVGFVRYISIV